MMIAAGLTSVLRIRVLDMVVYDKLIHMTIGIFFAVLYFREFQDDNSFIVATGFAILYEIFVYVVYMALLLFILRDFESLQSPLGFLSNFLNNYRYIDEWADVIVTWFGVILGNYVKSEDGFI